MKDIDVHIKATFQIPDDWAVVELPYNDQGHTIEVIRANDHYCFFTVQFLFDAIPKFDCQTNFLEEWIRMLKAETCDIVEPLKSDVEK